MKSIEIISIWYRGPISSSPPDRPPQFHLLKEEQPPALQPDDAGWSVGPKLLEKWPNQNDHWKNVNNKWTEMDPKQFTLV